MPYEPVVRAKIKTLVFTEKNADASAMMDDSKVIDHIQKKLNKQFLDNDIESVHAYYTAFTKAYRSIYKNKKRPISYANESPNVYRKPVQAQHGPDKLHIILLFPLMSLKGADSLKN